MSSHLSTMIVVGPVQLKPSKKLGIRVLKAAKKVQQKIKDALEAGDEIAFGGEYLSRDEMEDVLAIKPETALMDLVELWGNYSDCLDVNAREAKVAGKRFRIFVAGDTSYGDEPEGDGFRVLLAAERLGMFPLLGLG